ncbi:MAG: hypothetical protein ACKVZH_22145 [Blastocatellia bacterium]
MKTVRVISLSLFVIGILAVALKLSGNEVVIANAKPKMPAYPRAFETDRPTASDPLAALQIPFLFSANHGGAGNDGTADLNPTGRSGIRALVSVQKIGKTETVTGFATGMDPYKAYVSLFYDAGSPGSGPCACLPSNPPPPSLAATCKTTDAPAVNFSQMVIGYWLPLIGSSTRTLQILKAGAPDAPGGAAFVELEKIGAVSVREDTQLGTPLPAAPDPGRFQLRSCGKFKQNK